MTPGGRIQSAIELLAAVLGSSRPADGVAAAFFRERRYIGAKDRRSVADRVWLILRRRARLGWWVSHAIARAKGRRRGGVSVSDSPGARLEEARRLVLADLVLSQNMPEARLDALSGDLHGPPGLNQDERDMLSAMVRQPLEHSAMPAWVRSEVPEWLEPILGLRFGPDLVPELTALNVEAPLDLRVNILKATREEAIARLAAEEITATPTPLSPLGLRLGSRINLGASPTFREGLVEVQDEGSQLVALLCDARPGHSVVDYCAGAGGKTLALAAAMANRGRLVACDVSAGRVDRAAVRLKRAGVHNVTRRVLEGETDRWLRRSEGGYDRVLVDAPCSGTGTWRRNPDAKWRLTADDIAELVVLQRRVLKAAATLVRPGGRLIYATCSLLPEENEAQITHFLEVVPGYTMLPPARIWAEAVGTPYPFGDVSTLSLTPHTTGTDGYFLSILERR
ncbi:MAG: RsmB/NOP family class I SAM-dependent RNA methyltransferase [Alphaproteobacteria bacterium]